MPGDRVIDGRDIWPLLSGRSKQSPHEALFYFKGNRLEAVRSGPWKLAIVEQIEDGIDKAKKPSAKPFVPKLFNLDADIGETTDVAAQHPDVVKRLQGYIQQMDGDLGVTGRGPGVRRQRRGQSAAAVAAAQRHGVRLTAQEKGDRHRRSSSGTSRLFGNIRGGASPPFPLSRACSEIKHVLQN